MARKPIGVNLDDNDMNNLEHNFIELYNSVFIFKDGTKFIKGTHIEDGAITHVKLGALAVDGSNLYPNAVIPSKIADNAIGGRHILNTVVSREKLSSRFLFNGRISTDTPIENVVNDGTYIVSAGNSGIFPEGESSASAWGMSVEVVNVNWVYQTIYKLDRPDIRYLRVKDNLNNIVYGWKKILFHSEENEKPNKKILMIGNSFSLNATKYVPNREPSKTLM